MRMFTRREALIAGAGLAALAATPSRAGQEEASRAVGWILGDNLSIGGLFYGNGDDTNAQKYLAQARAIAANINLQVPNYPERGSDQEATMSAIIEYLANGAGWHVGEQLAQGFGKDAGVLFEVAVKSNILIWVYQPGDDSGGGGLISSRLDGLVPRELWQPILDAIAAKKPANDFQQVMFAAHKAIADYLVKQTS